MRNTVSPSPVRKAGRTPNRLTIGSWNLEGMTDLKLHKICTYMKLHSIDILCIQETRKINSDKYLSDDGCTVLLSGSGESCREWAGVGFVISARADRCVIGFRPLSNRIACLKLRVAGGTLALFTTLAPHNLRPLPEKAAFYDELDQAVQVVRANGPTYIFGDLNARLGQRRPGEPRPSR